MSSELDYLRSLGIDLEGIQTERFKVIKDEETFRSLSYSDKVKQIRHLEAELEGRLKSFGVHNTMWLRYLLTKAYQGSNLPSIKTLQGWGRKDRTKVLSGYRVELPRAQD